MENPLGRLSNKERVALDRWLYKTEAYRGWQEKEEVKNAEIGFKKSVSERLRYSMVGICEEEGREVRPVRFEEVSKCTPYFR